MLTRGRAGVIRAGIAVAIAFCIAPIGAASVAEGAAQAPQADVDPLPAAAPLPTPPGTTERVSVGSGGRQGGAGSGGASAVLESMNGDQAISADGRWVAFASAATNLIPGEPHPAGGIFLRDRQTATTAAIPWVDGGVFPAGVIGAEPAISGDGAVVAFTAIITNAVAARAVAVSTTKPYVLVWDRATNLIEVVSVDSNAKPVAGYQSSISDDGRYVAYTRWFVDTSAPVLSDLTTDGSVSDGQYYIFGPGCGPPRSATIRVTATDPDDAVSAVTLFYQPTGSAVRSTLMRKSGSNVWVATIDAEAWDAGPINYWVRAADSHGNESQLDQSNNYILNKGNCIL